MNPESLEALLLDRALGQLSPEVLELLDAHLQANPETRQLATEFSSTVQWAAAALAEPAVLPIPPRPVASWWWHEYRAAAAAFVVGGFLTFLAVRPSEGPVAVQPPSRPSEVPVSVPSPAVPSPGRALPFWSRERARQIAKISSPYTQSNVNHP